MLTSGAFLWGGGASDPAVPVSGRSAMRKRDQFGEDFEENSELGLAVTRERLLMPWPRVALVAPLTPRVGSRQAQESSASTCLQGCRTILWFEDIGGQFIA